jgi:predicted transcriptional regulator
MQRELVSVSILPETKSLVGKIAEATNEKKFAIYDRAIREYAKKIKQAIAPGA